ncbi:MAG: hypothetical protein KC461_04525 [Dehalococcoidia bacterium]|nr:hypothetical protein [Dehalococcoidia bacterium]
MASRRPRRPAGAFASYASPDALESPARFIATLKSEDGLAVAGAWVSIHLHGPGLLRPEGAYDGRGFTFQQTDDSGVLAFTWLPAHRSTDGPIRIGASSASPGNLRLRRL